MIAGVPGAGLNGVFYLFLAIMMPVRRLWHSATRRGPAVQWRQIAFLLAIAVGMTAMLYFEFEGIEHLDVFVIKHVSGNGMAARTTEAFEKLAPRFTWIPIILMGAILGGVHVLRLALWLAGKLGRARVAPLLIAGLALAALLGCRTDARPLAVYPPAGFNYKSAPRAIRVEHAGLDDFYQLYFTQMTGTPAGDTYGMALANQVLGILRNDPAYIERARDLYARHRDAAADPRQKECAALGARYCTALLSGRYAKAAEPGPAEPVTYDKAPAPAGVFHRIILGRSVIHVPKNALIKCQADRVTRDWLEAFRVKADPWDCTFEELFPSHEGSRIHDLVQYTGARVAPVWGMKAVKIGDAWYAPDAEGKPRFEISEDKILDYPTTIVVDDHTAIVNDTHGISALAWDSLGANLVVGCGDHPGKMDAAYYLARHGVNVYFPTDRYSGRLIGTRTQGTIIGSAPIKQTAAGADIGNQPVAIDVDETIVVCKGSWQYPLWYYDTPWQYFTALGDYLGKPLKLVVVEVTEYGEATNVVDAARKAGAKVLGIRVKSRDEHDAVAQWLKEDPSRRAILFHTAAYAAGYRLFFEFPGQTSFGDLHPAFE